MVIVGITGGSGSGKSLFCQYLRKICAAALLDADEIYHELTDSRSACTRAIASAFGEAVLNDDGSLCRPALAAVVFAKGEAAAKRLEQLNEITHRFVREEFEHRMALFKEEGFSVVLLDVPLLFESEFDRLCQFTISVLAERELRIARIVERDGISEDAAARRLDAQPSDDFYIKRSDAIVYNSESTENLKKQAHIIAERFGLQINQ